MCWVDSEVWWAGVGLRNADEAEKRRRMMWWDGQRGTEARYWGVLTDRQTQLQMSADNWVLTMYITHMTLSNRQCYQLVNYRPVSQQINVMIKQPCSSSVKPWCRSATWPSCFCCNDAQLDTQFQGQTQARDSDKPRLSVPPYTTHRIHYWVEQTHTGQYTTTCCKPPGTSLHLSNQKTQFTYSRTCRQFFSTVMSDSNTHVSIVPLPVMFKWSYTILSCTSIQCSLSK